MLGLPLQQAEVLLLRYWWYCSSICAATSAQKAKRLFERARLALRCSVSATFRASVSPC